MTGLVLKLKPHEKLLINGVVLQNGEKAARLRIRTAGAAVLRSRDALHPKDAKSPLQKAYYVAQLAVAGAADRKAARLEFLEILEAATLGAHGDEGAEVVCARAHAEAGDLFGAMRAIRKFALPEKDAGAPIAERDELCFSPLSR